MDKIDAFLHTINFPSFYLKVILSFITSLLITYYSIPTIIKISRRKNLMDEPGQRSSHERKIPNLGGIALFFAISVSASIFAYQLFDLYKFLFASLVIIVLKKEINPSIINIALMFIAYIFTLYLSKKLIKRNEDGAHNHTTQEDIKMEGK